MKHDMNRSLDKLLIIAIKAEINAQKIYIELAGIAETFILKEKLTFLAGEEEKHETILRGIFDKHFPGREPRIVKKSVAPNPDIILDREAPLSELLFQAMKAELEAEEFYTALSGKFPGAPNVGKMLNYLARVEHSHYQILKGEHEALLDFEQFDEYHEMMHIGA